MQQDTVTDHTLLQELNEWASQHIALDMERVPPLYQFTTAVLANEARLVQTVFFRASMWLFAVDDVYDGSTFSLDELRNITTFLLGDDATAPPASFSERKLALIIDLKYMLQELLALLSPVLSQNERGYGYLMNTIGDVLHGMLTETSRKGEAPPDIASYLETGRSSVGIPPIFFLTFCCMDNSFSTAHAYAWLDHLFKPFGEAVRLMNDKRSYERELQEQKLNSVAIIRHYSTSSDSYNYALEQVDILIEERIQQLKQIAATAPGEPYRKFARCTLKVSEVTQQFYAIRDFK